VFAVYLGIVPVPAAYLCVGLVTAALPSYLLALVLVLNQGVYRSVRVYAPDDP